MSIDTYDPDIAPDRELWLALDEQARISWTIRAHEGRFPDALHNGEANEVMHGSLHAIIESQIAMGEPPATRRAVERLTADGLKRHAAVHAAMQLLARQLADLSNEGARFDKDAYSQDMDRLGAADALEEALKSARIQNSEEAPMNRSQRRAAARKRRKKPPKRS